MPVIAIILFLAATPSSAAVSAACPDLRGVWSPCSGTVGRYLPTQVSIRQTRSRRGVTTYYITETDGRGIQATDTYAASGRPAVTRHRNGASVTLTVTCHGDKVRAAQVGVRNGRRFSSTASTFRIQEGRYRHHTSGVIGPDQIRETLVCRRAGGE